MMRWLAIAAVLVGVDQLSKLAVLRLLPPSGVELAPFFNLILVYVGSPGTELEFAL